MHTEHTLQTPSYFPAAATCLTLHAPWSWTKTAKWKWKNKGRILQFGIHTHCLAHHLPGAPNTDYLAYLVDSQEAITCNNTLVAQQMGNRTKSIIFDTWQNSLSYIYSGWVHGQGKQAPLQPDIGGCVRARDFYISDLMTFLHNFWCVKMSSSHQKKMYKKVKKLC